MNENLITFYRLSGTGDYSFDYHSHQEYEIYFFHSGSCRYLINNHIYDLKPGDILLMDGMTLHRPNVQPNYEYIRSVVHFSPLWIKGVLQEMGSMYLLDPFQNLQHCLIRTNENDKSKYLEDVCRRLSQLSNPTLNIEDNNIQVETERKVLLLQVLIIVNQLVKEARLEIPDKKEAKTEQAEKIASYIQLNYMKKLTLDFIAEELNVSKSYLSHVFKEITGFTVMEYLMKCRLTQVKYLLEMEPDKPLKDIAYECGFESVAHFSRYFREKVGVTAKEYRRLRLAME
ncbi:AraC-like DNA-binding protein [Evansella vedderi]|uniref:AraC-like DNA-binding protein n=2 Tax=Evansella vedderi TaxID=38282 RepID=A0ABU0A153_9BACI|nr:AraC-like DNA-binding protein [Evansella vedderi]